MTKEEIYKIKKSYGIATDFEINMHLIKKITIIKFIKKLLMNGEHVQKLLVDFDNIRTIYGIIDLENNQVISLNGEVLPILKTDNHGKILAIYANSIEFGKDYVIPHHIYDVNWDNLSNEEYENIKSSYKNYLKSIAKKEKQKKLRR